MTTTTVSILDEVDAHIERVVEARNVLERLIENCPQASEWSMRAFGSDVFYFRRRSHAPHLNPRQFAKAIGTYWTRANGNWTAPMREMPEWRVVLWDAETPFALPEQVDLD